MVLGGGDAAWACDGGVGGDVLERLGLLGCGREHGEGFAAVRGVVVLLCDGQVRDVCVWSHAIRAGGGDCIWRDEEGIRWFFKGTLRHEC